MKLEYPGIEGSGELYLKVLKAICGDTQGKSMVDLMCHKAPYTPKLGFEKRTYVDIQFRGLDFKEEERFFHNRDVIEFIHDGYWRDKSFFVDVAICSDGIEHLSREDGFELLNGMEQRSYKQIIFTPLGEYMITDDDHPDSHKSGWMPEDLSNYASIVFPDFHPQLNTGAFFAWHCNDIEQDFERVKNELKNIL